MAGSPASWRLIREEEWGGPMNMALDEVAARTAGNGGPSTMRVYQWSPATFSLGYTQDAGTVDWAYCESEGISVVRRQTGGGGIYHDTYGDISYSITVPRDAVPGDLMEAYRVLLEPVFDAFDLMGVDARLVGEEQPAIYEPACYLRALHPAHDVVAGESGRKISGNAQYRMRDAVVQHGSITYAPQPETHLDVFTEPVDRDSFTKRVTGISEVADISRADAVAAVEEVFQEWGTATVGDWTNDERATAREIAKTKYASSHWNRDRQDPLSQD